MRKELRIAFTLYRGNPHSGGQGVYTAFLTRELAALGHHVEVFSGPPYPELDPRVVLRRLPGLDLLREPDPFRFPRLSEYHSIGDLLEVGLMSTGAFPDPKGFGWRLRRHIDELRTDFDVVHDNQSLNWTLARLARSGMPVLASIHHPITVDRRLALEAATSVKARVGLHRFYSFIPMQVSVARELPRILTVSTSSAGDLARELGIDRRRVAVVPIGVDTDLYAPQPDIARERGLVCTTASADVPLKGLRYLIEAISLLPDTRLIIMGPHQNSTELPLLIARFGLQERVTVTGALSREEMVSIYARASVAVVPSLYEGFSLPAVEAMSCAVPLVASRGGALPEVVGDAGAMTTPGSVRSLAEAIEAVLASGPVALERGLYARERAIARFSWRSTALATQGYYRELLGSSE
ncbi:glycosyltransferase family 4 protein [Ferrimicrobium sp.]|uniref:glycosyltransferase family 4 protein n=1 Tax=Ferrimicrobium sp. TaxID=2926050 RepID=UPI0026271EFC|nr:glycosyltransferase family 4 protein [Ferrimicrobium sp.]